MLPLFGKDDAFAVPDSRTPRQALVKQGFYQDHTHEKI
jgi:hypothetical protein